MLGWQDSFNLVMVVMQRIVLIMILIRGAQLKRSGNKTKERPAPATRSYSARHHAFEFNWMTLLPFPYS